MSANKIFNVAILIVVAQVFTTMAFETKQCKGVDVKLTERQIMGIKQCAESVGYAKKDGNKPTPEQYGCISKCALEKKGVLDAAGKPNKETAHKFIDAAFPDSVKDDLKMATEKCYVTHGGKLNPGDASCMSYLDLARCLKEEFTAICK